MLISIVTVNYNNLKGLQKTTASVLEQTYNTIEYIVIDGGSTDGSKAFIEKQQDHLAYWVSEPDHGIYHAMNKGVKVAKGDYVLFLNSGDSFFSNNALSHFQPYVLKDFPRAIIYGNIQVISHTKWIKTYPEVLDFKYFVKDTLPHPATLIYRRCFTDFEYDEDLKIVSDWKFFMIGICKKKFTYQYIDAVISNFNLDGISCTSPDLVRLERENVLRNEFYWQLMVYKIKLYLKRLLN
ncbi:glycosyltransferase family 2 protein [Gaetbulibacter sp. M235]|uniref:glycosyltransferase family 2 protein n=1 Tax=Gaetbulibacter sp. M235 TaxID=3126510 RepID=UPI00374F9B87